MDTIKVNKTKTKMIAHRGLSGLEKENTAAAFIAAGNRSYFGMETDIHLTKDKVFVISHDDVTNRVSPYQVEIKNLTLQELQKINLFEVGSDYTLPYLLYPTLKEYLLICKKYEKHCIIELKIAFTENDIKKLFKEISTYYDLDKVILISFNLDNLKKARKLNPTINLQYLVGKYREELVDICSSLKMGIDILYHDLTQEQVDSFHKKDVEVNVWTVNDINEGNRLISLGVDYITTNILE